MAVSPSSVATYIAPRLRATLHADPGTGCEAMRRGSDGVLTSRKLIPLLPLATASVAPATSMCRAAPAELYVPMITGAAGLVRSTTATPCSRSA